MCAAAALTNGTIQLWSVTGNFGRSAAVGVVPVPRPQQALFGGKQKWKYASGAKQIIKSAHPNGIEVTDLKLLRDGHSMLSRAADDTAKLWDVRKLTAAVHEWPLPLPHSHARLCVSPQEDLLIAGTRLRACLSVTRRECPMHSELLRRSNTALPLLGMWHMALCHVLLALAASSETQAGSNLDAHV